MKRVLPALNDAVDPRVKLEVGAILAEGGHFFEADTLFNAYLRANPKDIDALLQHTIVKDALGQTQEALQIIIQAYRTNPEATAQRLGSNKELQRIAAPLFRRQ